MAARSITLRDATDRRVRLGLVARRDDGGLDVRWPDGRRLVVPAAAIGRDEGDEVRLTLPFAALLGDASADMSGIAGPGAGDGDPEPTADAEGREVVIPLVGEEVVIDTQRHETGTVRVRTRTSEREESIEALLQREEVEVRHVPVDRIVDEPAPVREEGETIILPLHEEVLVVEKRLLLREEVHLSKHREQRRETRSVRLRSEQADVERAESDDPRRGESDDT